MTFTNRFLHRGLPLTVMMSITCFSVPAQAGGLYIGEFGQPNQGASRAGANAIAEDASVAFQNPAATMFLDGKKTMATGMLISSKIEFDQKETYSSPGDSAVANNGRTGAASNGGDAGGTAVGGAFFHANPINDKWGWSIALASISGAVLDYEDGEDFSGRYWASEVELFTVGLTPSLSYKINDDLSIGASMIVTYAELDMDVKIPGPAAVVNDGLAEVNDGDDIEVAFGASALWQATDSLRLGLLYASETELDFDSDLVITLPSGVSRGSIDADVEFTYPQTLRLSAAQDLNDKLTLLASVAWEDWSAFDEILISTPGPSGALERDWDDTYHFSVGLRWQAAARWTYYTGIAYDTDPTSASKRTADMPIDEQWRYSGGVTYERDNGHKIGGVLTYADYGDAKIDNGGARPGPLDNSWTVKGDYDTNRLIFMGLNYGW
jgi:long-chain fatty acid transport protein